MKRVVGLALVLFVLGWTALPARAVIGALDQVPAATLLAPYFEVDLGSPSGVNTLISINNAAAAAAVVQVVLYSDMSVATMAFNLYLTGYDVQTISLRNLLNGVLPQTADQANDPGDTLSPQGLFSQEATFPGCAGLLPPPAPNPNFVTHLRLIHTGQASDLFAGNCAGQTLGDNIARGYVVVNVLNACSPDVVPGDPSYFLPGGTGIAGNQNVLWGDVFYVDDANNFAQGGPLVHIEADALNPATSVAGRYTFFGRYVNWTAADNREPLATNFAVRFLNGGAFNGGTDLITWRDSKVIQQPFACPATNGTPAWYPLGQEQVVIFDEQENPDVPESIPVGPPPPPTVFIPFPAEANRTQVGGPALPVPFTFGWLYLNLNVNVPAAGPNPPIDPLAAQAFVMAVHDAEGRFSVGYNAIQVDSATAANHILIGP